MKCALFPVCYPLAKEKAAIAFLKIWQEYTGHWLSGDLVRAWTFTK